MIEQIRTDQGVKAAMVAATNIIINAIKVMDLRLGDIEMDDIWWTVTLIAGRGV